MWMKYLSNNENITKHYIPQIIVIETTDTLVESIVPGADLFKKKLN